MLSALRVNESAPDIHSSESPPNNSLKPWKITPAYCAGPAAGSRLDHPGRIPPRTRDPG
jgi:hypothetical protein